MPKIRVSTEAGQLHTRATANTVRQRLGSIRTFFDRIIEWDWDDAPARTPIFSIDLPIVDDPLPKFLDDAQAAALLPTASSDPDPLRRLVIHLLLRTGMRAGELCNLQTGAVVTMRDGHWLRIPLGKLHNDRYIPLWQRWGRLCHISAVLSGRMPSLRVYAGPLLTVVGLLGAASVLLAGPFGFALAVACAVALAIRGDWLPAVALAGVTTLVLVTLLMLGAPASVELSEVPVGLR